MSQNGRTAAGLGGRGIRMCAREDIVKTEIYESDPFTPKKGRLLATLSTEYRFEKGDELFFDDEPSRLKVRIIERPDARQGQRRRVPRHPGAEAVAAASWTVARAIVG